MASLPATPAEAAEPLPGALRVAVFAPYPALRAGIRSFLSGAEGIAVIAEFAISALDTVDLTLADILVGDPGDQDPSPVLAEGLRDHPALLLIGDVTPYAPLVTARTTALGFLSREASSADIAAAAHVVAAGHFVIDPAFLDSLLSPHTSAAGEATALTDREVDVLRLMAEGLPNKTIANRLGISEHTAKFHVGAILGKLNAASRTEAVMTAARNGWLTL